MPLLDKNHKIIMGWTPKAGCTVAIQMFFDHMGILEEAFRISDWVHDYRDKVFYKKFGSAEGEFSNPEYFKFKVVRNPYDRAVSSFLHYVRYNAPQGLSFNEYLSRLIKNPSDFDAHHQPQIYGRNYDKIVKLENLENEMQEINKMRGTSFKTNYSSSHHHVKLPKSNNFFGELIFKSNMKYKDIKFKAIGNPLLKNNNMVVPHYDDFYNQWIRSKVQKLFYNDFCTYGYDF